MDEETVSDFCIFGLIYKIKFKEKVPSSSSVAVVGEAAASCEMCANYEVRRNGN
jgi:hypothetical protein